MREKNISEILHAQFDKFNKLLKRNTFEQRVEHIKAVPYKGQGKILRLLLEHGELSQKDLVIEMDIRPSTVWELVNKLEKSGFVEKIQNPDDKRGTIISLTESGKQEAKSAKWNLNNIPSELYSVLNNEEQQQLSGLLDKLIVSLKKTEKQTESDDNEEEGCNEKDLGQKLRCELGVDLKNDVEHSKQFFKDFFTDLGIKKNTNQKNAKPKSVKYEITEEDNAEEATTDNTEE